MSKSLLAEHLVERKRFERGGQAQRLAGLKLRDGIEDRCKWRLFRRDDRPDIEIEVWGGRHGDQVSRGEPGVP